MRKSITDLTIASFMEKTLRIEYDADDNPIYIGEAESGTANSKIGWRIKKLVWDASGNLTDILWAEGDDKFNKIWDNRSTYNYS